MTADLKKTSKSSKFFSAMVIFLAAALCVLSANLFSSAITAGAVSLVGVGSKNLAFDVYCLYSDCFQTKSEADKNALQIVSENGGGFVLFYNSNYYVLHSVYLEENDAKKVCQNLENTLKLKTLKIELQNINTTDDGSFQSLAIFKTSLASACDVSVCHDTNTCSTEQTSQNLSKILQDVYLAKNKFSQDLSETTSDKIYVAKTKISALATAIEDVIAAFPGNHPSSLLKYLCCNILSVRLDLEQSLDA